MSSGSRPPSPSPPAPVSAPSHGPASALAPAHEAQATLTVSPSPSPVPPTPPPKDMPFFRHQDDQAPTTASPTATARGAGTDTGKGTGTGTGSAMSKLGVKAAPPAMEDPTEVLVIDISRPVGEHDADPDSTLRADDDGDEDLDGEGDLDGDGHSERTTGRDHARIRERGEKDGAVPASRDSDVTDMTDADITIVHPVRRSDSPEPGGSTLYGSAAGLGDERERERDRERVQEHPLKLALHPPSPPPWDENRGGDGDGNGDMGRDRDLENGRRVLDEDLEEDDGDLGLGGRSGRASPQRYVLSSAKAQRVHDFNNKPRSHNRRLIPHSAYYFGPPPPGSAYGTDPCGQIGVHHPREIVRIERDYTGGELPQFTPTYPLELEGRITPTQFLETVNAINEILLSAHSLGHAFVDNALAFFSLQVTRAVKKTHYEKEMDRLHALIDELNVQIYNPMGLHIKWPHSVAFLFLEVEYY